MRVERVAAKIVDKWLRKGNMARCMRDILPRSGLSFEDREKVARIVHDIVRYKRYYDYLLESAGKDKRGKNYVLASQGKIKSNIEKLPLEVRESISSSLAGLIEKYPDFLKIINREPETILCANLIKESREKIMEMLKEEGFFAQEYVPETAIITSSAARYSKVVKEGFAHVQDASSQMVAKITGQFGHRILDFCAGNGGKSLAIASIYRNRKEIQTYDVNEKKLRILEKRAERYGAKIKVNYEIPVEKFDVVLVDAPCSGIGAASRNPEAKYVEDFSRYGEMQFDILKEAMKNVKMGGYLIYVVCSFSPGETVEIIRRFLKKKPNFVEEKLKMKKDYFKNMDVGAFLTLGDILYLAILQRVH